VGERLILTQLRTLMPTMKISEGCPDRTFARFCRDSLWCGAVISPDHWWTPVKEAQHKAAGGTKELLLWLLQDSHLSMGWDIYKKRNLVRPSSKKPFRMWRESIWSDCTNRLPNQAFRMGCDRGDERAVPNICKYLIFHCNTDQAMCLRRCEEEHSRKAGRASS